jgi:hypothetical protein
MKIQICSYVYVMNMHVNSGQFESQQHLCAMFVCVNV